MGVQGLLSFIEANAHLLLDDYKLRSTELVIDAHNICHHLFYEFEEAKSRNFGGNYYHFAKTVERFFEILRRCDVTPYVIFDGPSDNSRFETLKSRSEKRVNDMNENLKKNEDVRCVPMMAYETFRYVLRKMKMKMKIVEVTCDSEADHQAAALAKDYKCPALSSDTDFLIYDIPEGVILFEFLSKTIRQYFDKPLVPAQYPIGDISFLEVKIYKRSSFARNTGLIDQQILPFFATILGNERIDETLQSGLLGKIPETGSSGRFRCYDSPSKRIIEVLNWLNSKSMDKALNEIVPEQDRQVREAISKSLTSYEYFSNPTEFHRSMNSYGRKPLPEWFVDSVRSGKVPSHALEAIQFRRILLPSQVSDMQLASPYHSSTSIRQFLYSVLLRWDAASQENQWVEEYDRDQVKKDDQKLQIKLNKVQEIPQLENGIPIPKLDEIESLSFEKRRSLLLEVLGVPELKDVPNIEPVVIGTIIYWLRSANPKVNHDHLEALLVCFHHHRLFRRSSEEASQETEDLSHFYSSEKRNFECHVIHAFAHFQCCLQSALYVNQILQLPIPDPYPVVAYNGTFLYNFYQMLANPARQKNLDSAVKRNSYKSIEYVADIKKTILKIAQKE